MQADMLAQNLAENQFLTTNQVNFSFPNTTAIGPFNNQTFGYPKRSKQFGEELKKEENQKEWQKILQDKL